MKKKQLPIVLVIILLVVLVSGYKFKQFFLDKDFLLLVNLNCDPASESCFVADCSAEEEDCDDQPYKKLEMSASDSPACLLSRECLDFRCSAGDGDCSIKNCSAGFLEEGERCFSIIDSNRFEDINSNT